MDHGVRGTPIRAEQAAQFGLVTAVAETDDLDAEVEKWITVLLERGRVAAEARAYWREGLVARIPRPSLPGDGAGA